MSGPPWKDVDPSTIRNGSVPKDVLAVVKDLCAKGWRLREQGHKYALYCPCGPGGAWIRVDGTTNGPRAARRIREKAKRCPDLHELM